ncbi:hypothetical protein ACIPVB_00160 [Microbacterium sp. NPDC090007]|uniref:hypothetical protein n=1 Tax=Microbacterium sp. NPDC090007 TaxID=3364204 RepID=UPI0038249CB8
MNEPGTETQTLLAVDDATYVLAPEEQVGDLVRRIEAAVHDGGRFERFSVAGGREVRVLFGRHTRVVLSVEAGAHGAHIPEPPPSDWDGG